MLNVNLDMENLPIPRRVNLSSLVIRHDDGKYHVTGYLPHDEFENPEPDSFTMFQPYVLLTLFQTMMIFITILIDMRGIRCSRFRFTMLAVSI